MKVVSELKGNRQLSSLRQIIRKKINMNRYPVRLLIARHPNDALHSVLASTGRQKQVLIKYVPETRCLSLPSPLPFC